MKNYLQKEIEKHELNKVHVLPYQPRESMPALIAYSDIQFIFMCPQMDADGFPSKVYTIMACERPLLVCSSNNTPIINFLTEKACAYLITEKDTDKRVELMKNFLQTANKEDLIKMGRCGLKEIEKHYSKSVVTKQYLDLVDSLF